MSNETFTQGEWSASLKKRAVVSTDSSGIDISGATCEDAIKYYGGNLIAESISPCNAHLISAAPDMYRALRVCRKILLDRGYGVCTGAQQIIDEALAKADGEQS